MMTQEPRRPASRRPTPDPRSPLFRLMLVTDRTLVAAGSLPAVVERAVAGGVDAVQLRDKDLPEQERIALGRDLRAVTQGRALLLVNGSVEVARACAADGVHLASDLTPRPPSLAGKGEPSPAAVERSASGVVERDTGNRGDSGSPFPAREGGRGVRSAPLLIGRSVHDLAAARRAEAEGVDYLLLGTIYPSRSHPGGRTGGPVLVSAVCGAVDRPVIAIGGITAENAGEVMRAGAAGVAVISAILGADDPEAAAAALARVVDAARRSLVGERV
jgi:thiamine-phosphate pyrophosphorylase